jgi:nucleoid-associated protein YgaU
MGIFDAVNDDLKNKSNDNKNQTNKNLGNDADGGLETYVVKSGDTLSGIAKHFYGSGSKYMVIFEHNRKVWSNHGKKEDPNILFPGWELEIPEL